MQLSSSSFEDGQAIPTEFAFGKIDAEQHVQLSENKNPQLSWDSAPEGTRSFVLICVDPDVPSKPDDVNQEGRTVPEDLPRVDFYHWVMVDIPAEQREIAAGSCSNEVTAGGKNLPSGPEGSRQGLNSYTQWFEGDPDMAGKYYGYDGPCPPWNDSIVHRYQFKLFATDLERCPVEDIFEGEAVLEAISGHILAQTQLTGLYSLNPEIQPV